MKRTKGINRKYHKLVVMAVKDYFGTETTNKEIQNIVDAVTSGSKCDDNHALFCVKTNLLDKKYTDSLMLG